ncbi:MAG: RNA methyltransferase [Candidatus Pacebacteria bacterium]|nr:RNA methyltransferase [Candidatus Paceibacterota bacterium]
MIIYGINPLLESLHSSLKPRRVMIQKGKSNPRIQGIQKLAAQNTIPIDMVANLEKLCGSSQHQGVAGDVSGLGETHLTDTTQLADQVVMLDSIQDPHNFGASMRVCDAFGFTDVIYHKGNSSGVTPAAVKVSTGAIFHLRLFESNLNKAVKWLTSRDYRLCVLEAEGNVTIYDADYTGRICIVMGSEGFGVRHNILRQANQVMSIPMRGHVSSLNVSCALTAVLSEIARQTSNTTVASQPRDV